MADGADRRSAAGRAVKPGRNISGASGLYGVWPDGVVVAAPALDDDLSFSQRAEDLATQQLWRRPR